MYELMFMVNALKKCSQINVCSWKENCKGKILNENQKFYLVLENALFKDYVTGKYLKY